MDIAGTEVGLLPPAIRVKGVEWWLLGIPLVEANERLLVGRLDVAVWYRCIVSLVVEYFTARESAGRKARSLGVSCRSRFVPNRSH